MRKRLVAALLVVTATGTIWWLTSDLKERRSPASAGSQYDLSQLDESAFQKNAIELVASSTKFKELSENLYEITLANFLGPKYAVSMCETYPFVKMVFVAEGVAVSGNPPELHIIFDCAGEEKIGPIVLDTKAISEVDPRAEQYPVEGADAEGHYMEDFWPTEWYLSSVQLLADGPDVLEVTASDFRRLRGDVLRILFP